MMKQTNCFAIKIENIQDDHDKKFYKLKYKNGWWMSCQYT